MAIKTLKELQQWVKQRQSRKTVGIFSDRDVKQFWEAQEILESAITGNSNISAFLYMKPTSTWSEYSNDTSYKGPCQTLRWWSNGEYICEREDAEHKSWDKLDASDTKPEFWGMLSCKVEHATELIGAIVKAWNLANKFDASFWDKPNDKNEITVRFKYKTEAE